MGSTLRKKKTVIDLKVENTYTRAEETRRINSHVDDSLEPQDIESLRDEDVPLFSNRISSSNKPERLRSFSSTVEVVRHIDVTATTSRISRRKKLKNTWSCNKRTILSPHLGSAPKVLPLKQTFDYTQDIVVEPMKLDDPYDRLSKARVERRLPVLEKPDLKVGSIKLVRPRHTRRMTEFKSTGFGAVICQMKEFTSYPLIEKASLVDTGKEDGLNELIRRNMVEDQAPKSTGKMYRMTHRRTVSQKDIPSLATLCSHNSKRAERVWQWKGAYGSLSNLAKR